MEIKRKGIIFALDAALAVTVVIIILINSSYYFSTSSKESLSQLQPVRIGSDIIALLDFGGSFEYAFDDLNNVESNGDEIPPDHLNVSTYLPKNYAMKYAVTDMKKTLTSTDPLGFCPPTGSNTWCVLGGGTTCNAAGCTLPSGGTLNIMPVVQTGKSGSLGIPAVNIINPGEHFISIGTDKTNATLSLNLEVNGIISSNLVALDPDTGIYFWGSTTLPIFELRDDPKNLIKITNPLTQSPVLIKWVRVVGDESYMRGAYSDDTLTGLPLDRFVGSGERFVAIIKPNGDFEGYHLVRYWIWLKTVMAGP